MDVCVCVCECESVFVSSPVHFSPVKSSRGIGEGEDEGRVCVCFAIYFVFHPMSRAGQGSSLGAQDGYNL